MVARFPQLHLDVHQLGSIQTVHAHIQESVVVFKNGTVVLLLNGRQLNINDSFFLSRNIFSDIFLHTSKHVWRDLRLETFHLLSTFHVPKSFKEIVQFWELKWLDEIEKGPKLV